MKYLNLDRNFEPYEKSIDYESLTFSGGEPHIKIMSELKGTDQVTITTRIREFNDVGLLVVAADALKRMGVNHLELLLPYFPGARQDRLMTEGEPLTVKVYAHLINELNLEKVTILDPHSDVTAALLNNVCVISNNEFVKQAVKDFDNFYLVSPDSGALKKIYKTASFLGGIEVVECGKQRNVLTRELSGFRVFNEHIENKTCVVVDDICDGGGTFIGLAKELRKREVHNLVLVVTHGIFSHGLTELLNWYNQVICTDSFSTIDDERIQQIKLNSELLK